MGASGVGGGGFEHVFDAAAHQIEGGGEKGQCEPAGEEGAPWWGGEQGLAVGDGVVHQVPQPDAGAAGVVLDETLHDQGAGDPSEDLDGDVWDQVGDEVTSDDPSR